MKEVDLGGERSFIGGWYLPDLTICDDLIAYFRQREDKIAGQTGHKGEVNAEVKDSVDVIVTPDQFSTPIITRYLATLYQVAEKYMEKYNATLFVDPWGVAESINMQFYKPMGGYKQWHTERIGRIAPSVYRNLVFMTYLNDVFDEGGTEFYCQKVKAEARKGLTLIWPADWTHTHRGVVSPTEEKYIITGWFSFL